MLEVEETNLILFSVTEGDFKVMENIFENLSVILDILDNLRLRRPLG